MARRSPSMPLWARGLIGFVAGVASMATLGTAIRYWLPTEAGRSLMVSLVDGQRMGALGTLRIERMSGDPMGSFVVADIALVDDHDVWLRARNVSIDWRPRRLLSGALEIDQITIKELDLLRRPEVTERPGKSSSRLPDIRIADARIEAIDLSALLPGVTETLAANGAVRLIPDSDGEARLEIAARRNASDGVRLRASWTAGGRLFAALEGEGPADGVLAGLIGGASDQAPELVASVEGTSGQLTATASLALGGRGVLEARGVRMADHVSWTGRLNPQDWPAMSDLARLAGGPVEVTGAATLVRRAPIPFTTTARSPGGGLSISGRLAETGASLDGPLDVAVTALDLSRLADIRGSLSARGRLRFEGPSAWTWDGRAAVDDMDVRLVSAGRIEGPLRLAREDRRIIWASEGAVAEAAVTPLARGLAPAAYTASARGEVSLRDRRVEVQRAQIDGAPGRLTGQGVWRLRTGEIDLAGAADLRDLSGVGGLDGAARGQWALQRAARDGPIRISVDGRGEQVRAKSALAQQVLGASPVVKASVLLQRGRVVLESGELSGAGARASLKGALIGEGALQGDVQGRLLKPLRIGGLTLQAGAVRGRLSGPLSAPRFNLKVSNGAADLMGETTGDIAGDVVLTLGRRPEGRIELAGVRADGSALRVAAAGRLGDRLDVTRLEVGLGGLALDLRDLRVAPGLVAASFSGSGPVDGLYGFTRGAIEARGRLALSATDLTVEATGQARNLRRGALSIDTADFDLRLADRTAQGSLHLSAPDAGDLDARLTLAGTGSGRNWSGSLKASGRLGGSPLASAAPLAWEISEAGGAASGSLSLLGGSLTGDIRLDRDARLDLAWSGVDLERLALLSLANPVNGEASGALQFRNPRDGEPSGALRLEVTGLNPQGLQLNPVNLAVDATLAGREMTATALGSGQGFALAAEGRARADIGSGFDVRLALEEPASGDLRIDGRIDSLWGLFGPPGQVLRGAVSSRVALRGSLAAPNLSGGFDLRDGGFEHAETGLLLRDIRLEGVFDQTALTLNGLSARDRTAGALTGGGKLAWSGGLSGDLRFAMKSLRVLSGEDREAVVSGDVRLVVQGRSSRAAGDLLVEQARFSIEQPAVERIPVLPSVRRVGFEAPAARRSATDAWPPLALDFAIRAPRRVVVFGRGLDTEWGGEVRLSGTTARPLLSGTAQLARGDLNLAGRRFAFEDGAVRFEGSPASTRIDISARRRAADLDARASVSGQLSDLTFDLSSTPALPRDEVLSRVLFSRSLAQLTPLEGAQLTAALNKLAGGQAAFDPAELLRNAVGLDRIALGSGADATAVSAGKYITRDVYLEVGAGGEGGVAADVEWQPSEGVSIISSARGNGDTRMAVRWKRDY